MLENISDYLSLYVLVFFTLAGLYFLFVVTGRHHAEKVKKREEAYYSLLEEIGNDYEDEDETEDFLSDEEK